MTPEEIRRNHIRHLVTMAMEERDTGRAYKRAAMRTRGDRREKLIAMAGACYEAARDFMRGARALKERTGV